MQQPFETAREVSEHLLERTRQALLTGAENDMVDCFSLPHDIQTFVGQRLITTEAELRSLFHAVTAHYRKIGVTDIVRHCVEAAFMDPHTVTATTETRLVNGNVIVQKPFPVFSVLKFRDGRWQVASSCYAIEDRPDHNAALMSAGTAVERKSPD